MSTAAPAFARARAKAPPPPKIDPADPALITWAKMVARVVRRRYGFRRGSEDERDLEGVALLEMVRRAGKFRPALVPAGPSLHDRFCRHAKLYVEKACRKAAERLTNGGTYHCKGGRYRKARVRVEHLSGLTTPAGDPLEVADPREPDADEPDADAPDADAPVILLGTRRKRDVDRTPEEPT